MLCNGIYCYANSVVFYHSAYLGRFRNYIDGR